MYCHPAFIVLMDYYDRKSDIYSCSLYQILKYDQKYNAK